MSSSCKRTLEKSPAPAWEQALPGARGTDRFHDECGVFGVHGHPEAAHMTYLGLYALQHRGQESAGIVASNGHEHLAHRGMGLVVDVFDEAKLAKLREITKPQPGEYVTNMAKIDWQRDPWEAAVKAAREGKPVIAYGPGMVGVPCGYG